MYDLWANYFIFQRLNFLIHKMEVVIGFCQAIAFCVREKRYVKCLAVGLVWKVFSTRYMLPPWKRQFLKWVYRNGVGGDRQIWDLLKTLFLDFRNIWLLWPSVSQSPLQGNSVLGLYSVCSQLACMLDWTWLLYLVSWGHLKLNKCKLNLSLVLMFPVLISVTYHYPCQKP